jgi:hypothetical protein
LRAWRPARPFWTWARAPASTASSPPRASAPPDAWSAWT